jgi:hypothetical protein
VILTYVPLNSHAMSRKLRTYTNGHPG